MRESTRRPQPWLARERALFICLILCSWCIAAAFVTGCGGDALEEARSLQAEGRYSESMEPLRTLLAERPDDPEINYRYGLALTTLGQPSLGEWSLRKAMQDPEWRVLSAMQLAAGAIASQNYDSALEAIEIVLADRPDEIPVLMMRANSLAHSRRDFEKALFDAERILELDPDYIDAYEPMVLSLIGLGRFEEAGAAIEALGEGLKRLEVPEKQLAWHCATLAVFAADSQKGPLARERWEGCLESYPAEPEVVWPAIKFYDAQREWTRSREILEAALEAEGGTREYRPALAARLRAEGRAEDAEARLRETLDAEDAAERILAAFDLVKHYQEVGRYADAAEIAERGIEESRKLGQPSPQLLLEHADSLLMSGDYDGALAVADAMELEAHSELIRARVAQERGDPAAALGHFDAAFRLWPNNPWARYAAAGAAEAVGDFDRATEEYRFAIRIDPTATDSRVQVARLLLRERRANEALQLIQLKNDEHPLEFDGQLVLLEALGADGRLAQGQATARYLAAVQPTAYGACMVAMSRGLASSGGVEPALQMLKTTAAEANSAATATAALREAVRIGSGAGRLDGLRPSIEMSLRRWPDAPGLGVVEADLRAAEGAPAAELKAAYEAALKRAPGDAQGWIGLGLALAEAEPDGALAAFDRALGLGPGPGIATRAQLGAASVLVAQGDPDRAISRLSAALADDPYSAELARALARLRLERDGADARTLELARRAVRFAPADEAEGAEALLERVRAAGAPVEGGGEI